jgi:O-antigen ligase
MSAKINDPKGNFTSKLYALVSCLIVVFTLFIAIWRILLWDIINPLIYANINRLIGLFNLPALGFEIAWTQIVWALSHFVIIAVLVLLGIKNKLIRQKKFWLLSIPLIAILLISLSSQFWSLIPPNTLKRAWFLFATTLGGIFIGLEIRRSRIILFFEILSIISVVFSYIFVFLYPLKGILTFDTPGAWIGFFNYKSFSGVMIAFASLMFLFRLANFKKEKLFVRIYSILFLLISLNFLYRTKNATALGAFILSAGVLALGLLFIKWGQRLKPIHWWILGGVSIVVFILAWVGKDTLFGLLGRNATLTGRVPTWIALIPFIKQRIFFGYGFGEVFWYTPYLEEFWKVAPWKAGLAHSGYVEAILNTGIVGFLFLISFLAEVGYLSLRYFNSQRNLYSLIFLIWFVYVILVNIPENLFGTYEIFNWLLLVVAFAYTLREQLDEKPSSVKQGSLTALS